MKQAALARAVERTGPRVPFRLLPGVEVFGGDFVLLAAAPGVGKSFVALDWAKQVASEGGERWVLYHSTDTSLRQQGERIARMFGVPVAELADLVLNLRWSDTPLRGIDELEALVSADIELMGCPPALVVVDLAMGIAPREEHEAVMETFLGMKTLARHVGAVVLGVHHIRKEDRLGYGKKMPLLSDILWGMERYPEVVLGACRPTKDVLRIGTLKHRGGRDDQEMAWGFDPGRSWFGARSEA